MQCYRRVCPDTSKKVSCLAGYRLNGPTPQPRKPAKPQAENGFTIIELLITIAIFCAVGLAIYATFNSGMSVWRSVKDADILKVRNSIRFEKLCRELRQTFNFTDIAFAATTQQIEFPQVINSDIVKIRYNLDEDKNLFRTQTKLADILQKQEPPSSKGETYFTNIEKFNFSYLYFDLEKSAYLWKETWTGPGLPLAVKIEATIAATNYAAIIFIPAV
ncbi:MAG: prepilin-type N-terminal cleavage/methylation domain-containing protein [Candidatus Omnitrophica bacterium]|nr:prepilin-type N-terminal cleavage/methylation domain-containing protein [Candidatus Omnitrophota bacterium]